MHHEPVTGHPEPGLLLGRALSTTIGLVAPDVTAPVTTAPGDAPLKSGGSECRHTAIGGVVVGGSRQRSTRGRLAGGSAS